ncbi:hypothetical protein [Microbacterium lacticum]
MTGTPENLPEMPDGPDLGALRDEIDELKKTPTEELISPVPTAVEENEPTPVPTDAIGSADEDDAKPAH